MKLPYFSFLEHQASKDFPLKLFTKHISCKYKTAPKRVIRMRVSGNLPVLSWRGAGVNVCVWQHGDGGGVCRGVRERRGGELDEDGVHRVRLAVTICQEHPDKWTLCRPWLTHFLFRPGDYLCSGSDGPGIRCCCSISAPRSPTCCPPCPRGPRTTRWMSARPSVWWPPRLASAADLRWPAATRGADLQRGWAGSGSGAWGSIGQSRGDRGGTGDTSPRSLLDLEHRHKE